MDSCGNCSDSVAFHTFYSFLITSINGGFLVNETMKLTPWLKLVEKCNGDGGGDKLAPSVYHISPTRKHETKDPIGNQR